MRKKVNGLFDLIAPYICHHAWVAYQMGAGQKFNLKPDKEDIASHKDAIEAFKKNPRLTAEQNHNNWMKYRKSCGWKYGLVKDKVKKTHPDLVPFNRLPRVEQMKDVMDIETRRFAYKLSLFVSAYFMSRVTKCFVESEKSGK